MIRRADPLVIVMLVALLALVVLQAKARDVAYERGYIEGQTAVYERWSESIQAEIDSLRDESGGVDRAGEPGRVWVR